ncbi:hypothetical protein CN918_27920 [Priestia megaterium]|nr:hypothetical protein CN918_27920 [Priestia megaterium]
MKKWLTVLVTLIIEFGITYGVAYLLNVRFFEIMVFTGIAFLLFAVGRTGILSNFMGSNVSAQTGIIQERETGYRKKGPFFYATLAFFLVGIVLFALLLMGIIPPSN